MSVAPYGALTVCVTAFPMTYVMGYTVSPLTGLFHTASYTSHGSQGFFRNQTPARNLLSKATYRRMPVLRVGCVTGRRISFQFARALRIIRITGKE